MRLSKAANDNLLHQTREVWKPRIGRDLSSEEARQIIENISGFFSILIEWSRVEISVPANDSAKPDTPDIDELPDGR